MDLSDAAAALTTVWHERMPLTTALGVEIGALDGERLKLLLPLAPNRNHKGTVFAGSLSALATLAGWSALWLVLREAEEQAHVVIQDARIHYKVPARGDVVARVPLPTGAAREKWLAALRKKGRARLGLEVEVVDLAGEVVATFEGRYVAHR